VVPAASTVISIARAFDITCMMRKLRIARRRVNAQRADRIPSAA